MDYNLDMEKVFRIAPVVVVTLSILAIGWYVGVTSNNAHIKTLKEFIEYLKNKGDK